MNVKMSFTNPDEFARFVKEYALVKPAMPIVISGVPHQELYSSMRRRHVDSPKHLCYTALCSMGNVHVTAELEMIPHILLEGWEHDNKQNIVCHTDSKQVCVDQLERLGVPEKELETLAKVKVSTLREMIDTSNAEWSEMTFKKKVDEATHYKFKTKELGEVKLDLSASSDRKNALDYTLTLSYGDEWRKMEARVNNALEKFSKFQANINIS